MSRRTSDTTASDPRLARLRLWLTLAVVIATILPFLPAVHAGFSDFDDHGFLLEADGWRGITPANVWWDFSTVRLGHYQPLTYLSYGVEHAFFGLDPRVFHATNILLHAISAGVLFRLILRLLALSGIGSDRLTPSTLASAAIGALAWGLHPLRVESVAWITERRDVLSALLLLLATSAYLRSAAPGEAKLGSPRAYAWCLVLLTLSLLAKAWGITFVAIALVLDWFPLRRLPASPLAWRTAEAGRVVAQKVPFAALGVVFALIAAYAQRTGSTENMKTLAEWGIAERVAQAAYGVVFYLVKSIAPTNLAPLYELPPSISWSDPKWIVVLVAAAVFVVGLVALHRRRSGIAAAGAIYLIVLLPVLGIAQSGIQLAADRYSYVAAMPLSVLLAGVLVRIWPRLPRANAGVIVGAGALALSLGLGAASWRQSTLWRSTLDLWSHTLAAGYDGPIIRDYYARQLEKGKRHKEALEQYRKSVAFEAGYADGWFGVGSAERALGNIDEARAAFEKSAQLAKDPTKSHLALGLLFVNDLKQFPEAIAAFREAVRATEKSGNPHNTGTPYLNLAAAYGVSGDDASAVEWLRAAAKFPDTRAAAEAHLRDMGVR